jgi:hypothetical protein
VYLCRQCSEQRVRFATSSLDEGKHEQSIRLYHRTPGVGKYTVASVLAARMPAKLVDNHYWLNPIFGLIQQDGFTPLPREVWNLVQQSRNVVLETIATLSPRDWNFVLTHGFEGTSRDYEMANEIFEVAGRRSADILVVRLTCSVDELTKRVVTPERRNRFK